MKVIIAGSRNTTGIHHVYAAVEKSGWLTQIVEVISGGATGIDQEGEQWAHECRVPVRRFIANWQKYGKSAGPIRNRQMAEYADALILIWNGLSLGSASMLREAKACKILIYEHIVTEPKR